ncbi:putative non-specific serine/threonine protein kinase [Helianthus annuus]|nr:putative non-specific serine/threonine protein kinase [Helianthus annuus]KAJ0563960.1 putative non-specific serine/threonine protein kinase [Helianthus annuus]KAJ0729292.1 putative non-specific serine/threonine protein kinase [Helianthus annuus]
MGTKLFVLTLPFYQEFYDGMYFCHLFFGHHSHILTQRNFRRRLSTKKVKLLPWLSCEAHSLLKGDPTLRLGSWTRGCHDIKNHKWVNEIASES